MAKHNNSVKILGASSHSAEERQKDDFYATDPRSLDLFLESIADDGIELHSQLWECACGDGALASRLKEKGHHVLATDKVYRGYPENFIHTLDFTKNDFKFEGDIITNPPFKHATEFVLKGLESIKKGNKVILFLRLNFLETMSRYNSIFSQTPPQYVYIHTKRVNTYKNNEEKYKSKQGAVCFAWFIWTKGLNTEPILRWMVEKNTQPSLFTEKGWSC